MKRQYLLFLLFCLTVNLHAQDIPLPEFITKDLNAYVYKGIMDWQIPGLALAVVKDGRIIVQRGYGFLEQGKQDKVDQNSTFMIGSNTKAFTATTLAILEEERKLKLKDKVAQRLPGITLQNPIAAQEVTITDLLSHQIGFETFQGDFTYWQSDLSRAEVIQTMGRITAPYDIRTKWGYCNACYVAAGEIIPEVYQKSWSETVKEKILTPLKMDRTLMLCSDLANASNNASAHTLVDGQLKTLPSHHLPHQSIDNLAAAGSMSSSASDMAKWLLAQINMGKVDGKEIISAKAIQQTRQPRAILGVDSRFEQETHFYLYGLGLMINDRAGKVVYSHTGGVDGFLSSVLFIPEIELGIAVLTNTDQNEFFQILTDQIRDVFLGLEFENYSEKALADAKERRAEEQQLKETRRDLVKEGNPTSLPLDAFTGTYTHPVYGDIEIKKEKGQLKIYFTHHKNLTVDLLHMRDDSFLGIYSNTIFGEEEFNFKARDGKVQNMVLKVADFVEMTDYEFVKRR